MTGDQSIDAPIIDDLGDTSDLPKIKDQHLLFLRFLLADPKMNRKVAAEKAGYVNKSCRQAANRLLNRPEVRAWKDHMVNLRAQKAMIDASYVLEGAKEMFERCMQREQVMEKGPDGQMEPTGEWKFDSAGAAQALKILGNHTKVSAFRDTDENGKVVDQRWVVDIVHSNKGDGPSAPRDVTPKAKSIPKSKPKTKTKTKPKPKPKQSAKERALAQTKAAQAKAKPKAHAKNNLTRKA